LAGNSKELAQTGADEQFCANSLLVTVWFFAEIILKCPVSGAKT
jgi:hypothetical protein